LQGLSLIKNLTYSVAEREASLTNPCHYVKATKTNTWGDAPGFINVAPLGLTI